MFQRQQWCWICPLYSNTNICRLAKIVHLCIMIIWLHGPFDHNYVFEVAQFLNTITLYIAVRRLGIWCVPLHVREKNWCPSGSASNYKTSTVRTQLSTITKKNILKCVNNLKKKYFSIFFHYLLQWYSIIEWIFHKYLGFRSINLFFW